MTTDELCDVRHLLKELHASQGRMLILVEQIIERYNAPVVVTDTSRGYVTDATGHTQVRVD